MLPIEETANPAISAVSRRRDPLTQSAPDNSAGSNSEFGPAYDDASLAKIEGRRPALNPGLALQISFRPEAVIRHPKLPSGLQSFTKRAVGHVSVLIFPLPTRCNRGAHPARESIAEVNGREVTGNFENPDSVVPTAMVMPARGPNSSMQVHP